MSIERAVLMLVYALLGLIAFFAPRDVHDAEMLLDALEKFSYALLIMYLLIHAFNFKIYKISEEIISFLLDFLEGLMYQSIYLIFANISGYLRLGRISLKRIFALIIQLVLIFVAWLSLQFSSIS